MGGRIALLLSLLMPSIVEKLIVVDSSPVSSTTEKGMKAIETFLNAISSVDLGYVAKENMERMSIKRYLDEKLKDGGIKDESRRQWLIMNLVCITTIDGREEYDWNFNLEVLKSCFRPNLTLLPQDALESNPFHKKTLFIGSPLSNYIPQDSHEEIRKHFPLAEFHYIDGAGHWVQADKPKEFIKVVLKFLTGSSAV